MHNYWLNISFRRGDLVYWNRRAYNASDWGFLISNYGSQPMTIDSVYYDPFFSEIRIDVIAQGRLVTAIDPKKVLKVSEDFIAH